MQGLNKQDRSIILSYTAPIRRRIWTSGWMKSDFGTHETTVGQILDTTLLSDAMEPLRQDVLKLVGERTLKVTTEALLEYVWSDVGLTVNISYKW